LQNSPKMPEPYTRANDGPACAGDPPISGRTPPCFDGAKRCIQHRSAIPPTTELAGFLAASPMKTIVSTLLFCGCMIAAGCGQKGALYLPDKNAAVVTRPAGSGGGTSSPATTTAPELPATGQGSPEQTPQNRAPEPSPSPTSEGTAPKPQQDKDKDQSKSPNSTAPRS
jgi:predicted small lipoprotein YifL